VLSQNATATKQAIAVADLFPGIADTEAWLADAESRAAEDLRDIVEGYDVVFRCNEVCSDTMGAYGCACLELNSAVADQRESSAGATHRLRAAVERAKGQKRRTLAPFREVVTRMIEVRERYVRFKGRRMEHAWQTFGRAIAVWADAERPLFAQLREALAEWRREGIVGEEVMVAVEERVAEEAEKERMLIGDL
jgi:hypothetical protein